MKIYSINLRAGQIPRKVPEGKFVWHNHIQHCAGMGHGVNGFRYRSHPLPINYRKFERCDCDVINLPHYKIRGVGDLIAAQEAREKAQHELRERRAREVREREIAGLHLQAARHESWRRNVEKTARNAVLRHHRQAVIAELGRQINPPPPVPEPEVIYIEQSDGSPYLGPDYNPKLAGQAVLRWR
jgi:hypothetical protein